jgi:hypothetical protein
MAFTQADVDALRAAIADGRGARSITFGDQSITFNSIDDMLKLLSIMQANVNATNGTQTRTRYAATSKGV